MVRFTVEAVGEALSYRWQSSVDSSRNWYNSSAGSYTPQLVVE